MSQTFELKLMKNEALSDAAKEALYQELSLAPPGKHGLLTRILSGLRISYRIYGLVLVSLFMLAGMSAVQFLSLDTTRKIENKADTYRSISSTLKDVELMLTRMEIADIGFNTSPEKAEQTFIDAEQNALSLAKHAQAQSLKHTAEISTLTQSTQQLAALFRTSKEARLAVGLSDTDGLRGVLNESSAVIDTELTLWPNVSNFQSIMTRIHRYEQSFLITRSKKDAGRLRKSLNEFDFAISGGPFGSDTRKKLSAAVRTYSKAVRKYVKAVKARTEAETAFTTQLHASRKLAQRLATQTENEFATVKAEEHRIQDATTKWQTIIMAVGLIVFIAFAIAIADSIHKPISNIRRAMNRIADGDSSIRVPGINRRDEIGAMARSIAVFKRTAQEVDRIREQEQKTKETAEQHRRDTLMQLADSFENTVRRVARSVQHSAKGIADNANTLSRDSHSTQQQGEEMTQSIGAAADIMGKVVTASDDLLSAVDSVDLRLTASGQSIDRATHGAKTITERVNALSHAAEGIGNVVTLITEIAEKTNLLALNATIEAARAGDAGKGFAVVANEVKQLAQQTRKATSNIDEQVKLIQADITETVEAISLVCSDIEEINTLTKNLNEAVQQQSSVSQDIRNQVSHAAESTDQVLSSLNSMKSAIAASSTSAHGVVVTVSELNQQSEQLEQELNAFIRNIHAL